MIQGPIIACITFAAGVSYETLNVAWVHCSERNMRWRVAALAGAMAGVELVGILGAVRQGALFGVAFVAGYTVGSFVGVSLKAALAARSGT